MIETIDARTPINHLPRSIAVWDHSRSRKGTVTYTHPETLDGLSLLAISGAPDGRWHLRAEGNLTTALYGSGSAAGSLAPDELQPARDAFLDLLRFHVPDLDIPRGIYWDLHRADPSTTLRTADDQQTSAIVTNLHRWWLAHKGTDEVLTLTHSNGPSVTYRPTKAFSVMAYDKRAESSTPIPPAIRLEARMRPRRMNDLDHRSWKPTLALDPHETEPIVKQLEVFATIVQAAANQTTTALVDIFIANGVKPTSALTLASVAQILGNDGIEGLTSRGIHLNTAYRYRKQIHDALDGKDLDAQMLDALDLPTLLARDLAHDG